jgi:hypothetical protein
MEGEANALVGSGKLFGMAGVLMALCCLAGPAILGAAASAAIGSVLGIAAAVVIAGAAVLLLRRWSGGSNAW